MSETKKTKSENYWRCRICDKIELFADEIRQHCISEHGHTPDYLEGYCDALEKISTEVKLRQL